MPGKFLAEFELYVMMAVARLGDAAYGAAVRREIEDRTGRLWVGTDRGLSEWIPRVEGFRTQRQDATNPRSLRDERVLSMLQDRGGVLWVGTYGGLSRWNAESGTFRLYRADDGDPEGLSSSVVKVPLL